MSNPANQLSCGFERIRSQPIASLNLTVEEFRHRKTGAVHFHLASDYDENVFLVALRTVPQDSTGVAHILEHTVLCGSKRFPVRDPFFMMTRRSLNTFMNAFTSSDWTAYPFASQNRKDFDNLLQVYLDAVFFSRLDPLDFAQEGHRLEFSEPSNPDSPLEFKGVVYNEMKGAMSSVNSVLWQTLTSYLYPSTTYHFNSGGDPEYIPDLSYEQLQAFYRSHYHPSNAILMTFGNIPATKHQQRFEELALNRFDRLDCHIGVDNEKRRCAPLRAEHYYALDEDSGTERKTHIVLGWLLGNSTDLEQLLEAHLLGGVLLDNSSSPLQHALETTSLGSAPSALCGLEDSNREMAFVCGLEGSEASLADQVETLILGTLTEVAEKGVSREQVEAVLHQLELQQREIGGDSYPYGLQLLLTALGSATHRGDPVSLLDLDPVLARLREKVQDSTYVPGLARRLLLDNQHRVRLVMRPDPRLSERTLASEKQRLEQIRLQLDETARLRIIETTEELRQRQNAVDDPSILPKVTLGDVSPGLSELPSRALTRAACPATVFERGTNGLCYLQLIVDLPALPDELLSLLPYYCSILGEIGVGRRDYLETQAWQASITGGLNVYSSVRGAIDDEQNALGRLTLSTKALARNAEPMSELLYATFSEPRFDEFNRLRELVQQIRARRDQSITANGHGLAMSAASGGMSPASALSERLSGLQGIRFTRQLDAELNQPSALATFAEHLNGLHQYVLKSSRQLLLITDPENREYAERAVLQQWDKLTDITDPGMRFRPIRERRVQIWQTSTQVNFCAMACPTVPTTHADAAALTVLGTFLRNGFLHRAIREQGGAYGAGAAQDNGNSSFRFFSYRDPRHLDTLNDFRAAVDWLRTEKHESRQVEEAILGIISGLDKPSSPAGEAKLQFHNAMFGRTVEQRQRFRARILAVTLDDLLRVASAYLDLDGASIAVLTNAEQARTLAEAPLMAAHQMFSLGN